MGIFREAFNSGLRSAKAKLVEEYLAQLNEFGQPDESGNDYVARQNRYIRKLRMSALWELLPGGVGRVCLDNGIIVSRTNLSGESEILAHWTIQDIETYFRTNYYK